MDAPSAREAVEDMYGRHGAYVARVCRAILGDRAEAEDAAQQVFVSALRALLAGTEPANAAAWLSAIARHECAGRLRPPLSLPLDDGLVAGRPDDPASLAIQRIELADAWRAIGELPVAQRDVLLLRVVQGLAYDELAEGLQLSRPAVRSLLRRARQTLRSRLERGAAALGGIPWVNALVRLVGDSSNPVLASVSKTAAVGVGALAITGGAVLMPAVAREPRGHAASPRAIQVARSPVRAPRVATAVTVPIPASTPTLRKPATRRAVVESGHGQVPRDRRDGRQRSGDGMSRGGGRDGPGSVSASGPGDGSVSMLGAPAVTVASSGSGDGTSGGGPSPTDGGGHGGSDADTRGPGSGS